VACGVWRCVYARDRCGHSWLRRPCHLPPFLPVIVHILCERSCVYENGKGGREGGGGCAVAWRWVRVCGGGCAVAVAMGVVCAHRWMM